jgi:hypothetical protein
MFSFDPLAGNIQHEVDQLIDRHQFLRSDFDGTRNPQGESATGVPYLDALVDGEMSVFVRGRPTPRSLQPSFKLSRRPELVLG